MKEDILDRYGPAVTLRLPGKHIAMINRCLGHHDPAFTDTVERFVSDRFADAWWWADHLTGPQKEEGRPQQASPALQMSALQSPALQSPRAGGPQLSPHTPVFVVEGTKPARQLQDAVPPELVQ